jgi:hypothetical protein
MITIQTLSRAAAIAAGLALIAVSPAGASPDPKSPAKAAPAAKSQRYCVETQVTGSRLARRTCKTRDAWIKSEGFDPAAK